MQHRKLSWLIILCLALLVAACGATGDAQPTAVPGGTQPTADAGGTEPMTDTEPVTDTEPMTDTEPVTDTGDAGEMIGGTVTVLGTWGGSEQDSFMAMVAPFEERTGIDVQYEGTRDLNAVLTTRVEGGNPPDLAGLPGPGQMATFAREGKLVDLSGIMDMDAYGQQYAQSWVDLGTVDGQFVGIFIKTSAKGFIWYNPSVWEANGWEQPTSWEEMMTLSQEMAATGTTPWCVGLESGAASGWPGTDWIEDIILRQSGPDVYDQWYRGELPWTSPEVKQAFETWGEIVADPNMVYGGAPTMLTMNFGNGGDELFTDPPSCYMHHQASFITDFFVQNNPALEPVTNFDFFTFPPFEGAEGESVVAAGDLFGMFNDTPQARALIQYLASPEAQAIWVAHGGALSPNREVSLDDYPDDLSRQAAELLTSAETVRFDGSDLMPEAMNNAFWAGILSYVQNPGDLDNILAGLDQVQSEAYAE